MREILDNGIVLPAVWPPRGREPMSRAVKPIPYLESPPEVIPINRGRQLFVDDFLIGQTTLKRTFHKPVKHPGNPVFFPETPWEKATLPCATPKSGGIWWDPPQKNLLCGMRPDGWGNWPTPPAPMACTGTGRI
jgi:hypothetical protein